MPGKSKDTTDQTSQSVPAVFLNNLEVELPYNPRLVELSILTQGLFSSQICLTDAQLVDNAGVRQFFLKNKDCILKSVAESDPDEVPLITTCGRGGGNCEHSLVVLLEPRGERRLPPPFTSFTPEANAALREGYPSLSSQTRKDRFCRLAGKEFPDYLWIASSYFLSCPDKTVLKGSKKKETRLFPLAEAVVDGLERDYQKVLTDEDRDICVRLQEVIRDPKAERNRERLHRAIYGGGEFPQVYDGRVRWETVGREPDRIADEWRFLINHIYNLDLADSFALRRGVNSSWHEARFSKEFATRISRQKVDELVVPTRIHAEYLTCDFVRGLRKQKDFWSSLQKMSVAPEEHFRYISERFAKHLVDVGRKDLVGRQVLDITKAAFDRATLIAFPTFFATAIALGQPAEMAALVGHGAMSVADGLRWAVERFFSSSLGTAIGTRTMNQEDFSNFVEEVKELSIND